LNRRSISNIVRCAGLIFWFSSCSHYTTAQELAVPTRYRLAVAEKKWALELTLPTIEITRSNFRLPKQSFPKSSFVSPIESFAENGDALLMTWQASREAIDRHDFTIRVLPAPHSMAPADFRDFVLKKIVKGERDKKYSNHNQIPVAAYKTKSVMASVYDEYGWEPPAGANLSSRNLEAYFVKDDVCATLTLTASTIDADDEALFYSLVDSLRFVDTSNPTTSFDYYQLGRVFHEHKDFKSAAEAFGAALKLEQHQRDLSHIRWRHLILDAAEVNEALSNWTGAAEALEYGLSEEPKNTFFLMELASTYALQGDEARTLAVLGKAFLYMRQENGPFKKQESGATVEWSFPDLSKSAAFKQLMKNKRFREAVRAIEEANSK
jgi:tetratricopeptide (TPR) repeat protein